MNSFKEDDKAENLHQIIATSMAELGLEPTTLPLSLQLGTYVPAAPRLPIKLKKKYVYQLTAYQNVI